MVIIEGSRFLVTILHWRRRASPCHVVLTDEDAVLWRRTKMGCVYIGCCLCWGQKGGGCHDPKHTQLVLGSRENMRGKVSLQAVPCDRGL